MDPWTFWRDILKSPKFILAPMVDHSELPWRMLSRKYDCSVAYTPMLHAANFANSKKYRDRYFSTCPEDRPLIVQFCANNPDTLVAAAKFLVDSCDGIDINLGCPQEIAKRGHYGAFLQDEWDLITEMIAKLRSELPSNLSVSCKVRRFEQIDKTVEYAMMLEKAGCTFIGVHARTREQRGVNSGLADWNHIKAIKENVKIPLVANGNIQSLDDAERCLFFTKADAVMTAEGNLYNPALFRNIHPPTWSVAKDYLDCVRRYPIAVGMAKAHLFKIFHRCIAIEENKDLLIKLGSSTSIEDLEQVVQDFRERFEAPNGESQAVSISTLPVPPYLCQPRFRYQVPLKSGAEDRLTSSVVSDVEAVDEQQHDKLFNKRIKLGA